MPGLTRFFANTYTLIPGATVFSDTGPGTVIVDANAFLRSTGSAGRGMDLLGGPWTVTVNGGVYTDGGFGIRFGDAAASATTNIGASGEVLGAETRGVFDGSGLEANGNLTVKNAGWIKGAHSLGGNSFGMNLNGDGTLNVTNSATGRIEAQSSGFLSVGIQASGAGNHTVVNQGTIDGQTHSINFNGLSNDVIRNSGVLAGDVVLGGGNDVFTNSITSGRVVKAGVVLGEIDMGAGDDRFFGGKNDETINDGNGTDIYKMGGGDDTVRFIGAGFDGPNDNFDGGTGSDTLDCSSVFGNALINLDTVAHTEPSTLLTLAANYMEGFEQPNRITNFENVIGNAQDNVIFGSKAANTISGGGGKDFLFGYAGNDTLLGGTGIDVIEGGAGRDVIDFGADADGDLAVYAAVSDSGVTAATRDLITNFIVGNDVIDLSAIDAIRGGTNDGFAFVGMNTNLLAAGELRAYWTATQTIIEGDVTGDGRADFSIALDGNLTLSGADFIL